MKIIDDCIAGFDFGRAEKLTDVSSEDLLIKTRAVLNQAMTSENLSATLKIGEWQLIAYTINRHASPGVYVLLSLTLAAIVVRRSEKIS